MHPMLEFAQVDWSIDKFQKPSEPSQRRQRVAMRLYVEPRRVKLDTVDQLGDHRGDIGYASAVQRTCREIKQRYFGIAHPNGSRLGILCHHTHLCDVSSYEEPNN